MTSQFAATRVKSKKKNGEQKDKAFDLSSNKQKQNHGKPRVIFLTLVSYNQFLDHTVHTASSRKKQWKSNAKQLFDVEPSRKRLENQSKEIKSLLLLRFWQQGGLKQNGNHNRKQPWLNKTETSEQMSVSLLLSYGKRNDGRVVPSEEVLPSSLQIPPLLPL